MWLHRLIAKHQRNQAKDKRIHKSERKALIRFKKRQSKFQNETYDEYFDKMWKEHRDGPIYRNDVLVRLYPQLIKLLNKKDVDKAKHREDKTLSKSIRRWYKIDKSMYK